MMGRETDRPAIGQKQGKGGRFSEGHDSAAHGRIAALAFATRQIFGPFS